MHTIGIYLEEVIVFVVFGHCSRCFTMMTHGQTASSFEKGDWTARQQLADGNSSCSRCGGIRGGGGCGGGGGGGNSRRQSAALHSHQCQTISEPESCVKSDVKKHTTALTVFVTTQRLIKYAILEITKPNKKAVHYSSHWS